MKVALISTIANFTVDQVNDLLLSVGHKVKEGDTISLSSTGTLPAPFDADDPSQVYYALNVGVDDFQLSYSAAKNFLSLSGVLADDTDETFGYPNHGFVNDERILFTTTGTLPAGLTAGIQYYVVNASINFWQVSLTKGGAVVPITTAGTGTLSATRGAPIDITSAGTNLHSYQSGVPVNPSETPEERKYVITYIAKYGDTEMESAPSLPSIETVLWRTGQRVGLTNMPTGPGTGNFNIVKKGIYRANTGNTSFSYQFVAEVSIDQLEFIDDVDPVDLGDPLATVDYDMPPFDMEGIKEMANGMLIAKSGKNICYSEPFRPHAWPILYRRQTHSDIVGIGTYGIMSLQPFSFGLIGTTKFPYTVRGTHPSDMTMDRIELDHPCVSKESIVDMGKYGVMYASSTGLIVASSQGISVGTRMQDGVWVITPEQWRALRPETIRAERWDQYYIGFYDDGTVQKGFLFDPNTQDFIFLDNYANAIYLNRQTGELFIVSNSKIQSWDTGAVLKATWKDKLRFATPKVSFTAARVEAQTYVDLTFVVDADGNEKVNRSVAGKNIFRINTGRLANLFELEVQTSDIIRSIEMATSIEELNGE